VKPLRQSDAEMRVAPASLRKAVAGKGTSKALRAKCQFGSICFAKLLESDASAHRFFKTER